MRNCEHKIIYCNLVMRVRYNVDTTTPAHKALYLNTKCLHRVWISFRFAYIYSRLNFVAKIYGLRIRIRRARSAFRLRAKKEKWKRLHVEHTTKLGSHHVYSHSGVVAAVRPVSDDTFHYRAETALSRDLITFSPEILLPDLIGNI